MALNSHFGSHGIDDFQNWILVSHPNCLLIRQYIGLHILILSQAMSSQAYHLLAHPLQTGLRIDVAATNSPLASQLQLPLDFNKAEVVRKLACYARRLITSLGKSSTREKMTLPIIMDLPGCRAPKPWDLIEPGRSIGTKRFSCSADEIREHCHLKLMPSVDV